MEKQYFGGLSEGDLLYYKNDDNEDVGTVLHIDWKDGCLYDMALTVRFSKLYDGGTIVVYAHSNMMECDCFRVRQ